MLRRFARSCLLVALCLGLLTGCERKPRARERDAKEAEAKARQQAKRNAERANAPLPEEPPVEVLRVASSGLPCAVDDAFAAKCRRCHTIPTRHGAPFVFLTWQDTQQKRGDEPLSMLIGRAVRSGFMPYRIEANPKVEPLTDEEKKTILDWVDAGAPRQDCDPSQRSKQLAPSLNSARSPAVKAKAAASGSPKPPADVGKTPR